jgi:hypothetical protein
VEIEEDGYERRKQRCKKGFVGYPNGDFSYTSSKNGACVH